MKKCFALLLCMLLLACKPPAALPEPEEESVASASEAQASGDWPVVEQIEKIPDEIESVDLEDRLPVYLKDGTVYLYASGVSTPLYRTSDGFFDVRDVKYNFLTDGTALTYCDPNDGTLHVVNLLDPTAPSKAIDPDVISGVKAFAQSSGSGDVILYLKDEPDGSEALYRYAGGESVRIEESVGTIGEFYLSPDGSAYIFYVYGRPEGSTLPDADCLVIDGEPIWAMDVIVWISEDLRTYLIADEGQLKLYSHGKGAEILTSECLWFDGYDAATGTFWWEDFDGNYCSYDGTQSRTVLENARAVRNSHTGAYVFSRDDAFWAQFRDGEPILLCTRDAFFGATDFDADEKTLWLAALNEEQTSVDLWRVTVDENGVRKELYAKDSDWWSIPLQGERVIRRNRTDQTIGDLYFNDRCIVRNAERLYTYAHEPEEPLLFVCSGRLYRFDGETLSAILDPAPPMGDPLGDGTWLFLTEDSVLCYYDGTRFHRLADGVSNYLFAPFPADRTTERYAHDDY